MLCSLVCWFTTDRIFMFSMPAVQETLGITLYHVDDGVEVTPAPTLAPTPAPTPAPSSDTTGEYEQLGCAEDDQAARVSDRTRTALAHRMGKSAAAGGVVMSRGYRDT